MQDQVAQYYQENERRDIIGMQDHSNDQKPTMRKPSPTFMSNEVLNQPIKNKDEHFQSSYNSYDRSFKSNERQATQVTVLGTHGVITSMEKKSESRKHSGNPKNQSFVTLGDEKIADFQQSFYNSLSNFPVIEKQNQASKPPLSQRTKLSARKNHTSVDHVLNNQFHTNDPSKASSIHQLAQKKRPDNARRSNGDVISHSHRNSIDRSMFLNKTRDLKAEDELSMRQKQTQSIYNQFQSRSNNSSKASGSFVDCLTIDYTKALNQYKNELLENARRHTISQQFQNMNSRSQSRNALEGKLSFEECLGLDPMKVVHDQKQKQRQKNQDITKKEIGRHQSKREQEKLKLIQRIEKTHGDFVNTFTGDPIQSAYMSKQSDQSTSYNTGRNSQQKKELQLSNYLKSQITQKQDEMMKQKKSQIMEEQVYLKILEKMELKEKQKLVNKQKEITHETRQSLRTSEVQKEKQELQKKIQSQRERDSLRGGPQHQQKKNDILTKYLQNNVLFNARERSTSKNRQQTLSKFLNPQ
ncbi:UNKNOWN [Stylonychia lemnae]|uniref:Uncharacterized protein n=1 Tax=Stylonychia lemnae TaxID=5949 RepID=A0A078BB51_STYLE|nr:UNKNOWN [Stylonychia lemnae]|eukprot:CDW90793.1 UNKNOWN [Stylonychia lemnae]